MQDLSVLKEQLNTDILMYVHMELVCAAPHTYIHYLLLHKKQVHWSALSVRSGQKTENMDFLFTVVIAPLSLSLSLFKTKWPLMEMDEKESLFRISRAICSSLPENRKHPNTLC